MLYRIKLKLAIAKYHLWLWYLISVRRMSAGHFDRAARSLGYSCTYRQEGEWQMRTYTKGDTLIKMRFRRLTKTGKSIETGR